MMHNTRNKNGASAQVPNDTMLTGNGACAFLRLTPAGLVKLYYAAELTCEGHEGSVPEMFLRAGDLREIDPFLVEHFREADIAALAEEVRSLLRAKGFELTKDVAIMITRRHWDDAVQEAIGGGGPDLVVVCNFLSAAASLWFFKDEHGNV